ncbi:hypothetical protein [Geothermobacter hydrogeniphilus]|nr:hypothetical protein [Geothermobacter hydrogeniphilus]
MGRYHRNVETVTAILDTTGILNLQDRAGRRIVIAPVDHVFWTEKLDAKEQKFQAPSDDDAGQARLELWISGTMDSAAEHELEQRGWTIVDQADRRLLKKMTFFVLN